MRQMLLSMYTIRETNPFEFIRILFEPPAKRSQSQHGGAKTFGEPVMTMEDISVDLAETSVDPVEPSVDPVEPSVDPAETSVDPVEPSVDPTEPDIDSAEPNVNPADQNEPAEQPQKSLKRKYNRYEKTHDKYTICYAYYLKKILGRSATSVSETTGIDYHLVYVLSKNKSLLYSDYIDEIKDMSKEELEQFLRELQNPQ